MSTRADVRNDIRTISGLWPDTDALAGTITAGASTLGISDGLRAPAGTVVEIDSEAMGVRSVASNTLTVRRGDRGTVPAAHTTAAAVLIYGQYHPTNFEINRHIRSGIEWLYPTADRDIWDDTTTTLANTLSYTVPSAIEVLDEVYLQGSRSPADWLRLNYWQDIGSKLFLPEPLPIGRLLKFHGRGRFTQPVADGDTLDCGDDLVQAVTYYAASLVVKSQEILRTRFVNVSALLEARSGNVPEMIGSSRELMKLATSIRDAQKSIQGVVLRRMFRRR